MSLVIDRVQSRHRSDIRRRRVVLLLAFVVCCWITYALRTPILTAAGEFLVQPDPLEPAEIIVVLAGDGTGFRIMTAVDLVQRDLAPKILVTGPPGHYGHYESELAIDFAVKKGAPREIFEAFPMHVQSTKEEAERVDAELRRRGTAKAIIVTSNFHTRRTRRIFRERAGDGVEYIIAAAPNPYFEPDQWWKTRPGKKVFFMEAMKTVNSWIE